MRWALSELSGYCLHGRDGSLGTVSDTYFDDVHWVVRYLAVRGHEQARPRSFLLAPQAICSTDREFGLISVFLRTAAVYNSPSITSPQNLPREEEARLREYFGWPNYWADAAVSVRTPHLHSMEQCLGYRVLAGGEDIGPLLDLIVDDHTWQIHFLELDASSWLPAGHIWIRSDCIQQVRSASKQLDLNLSRAAVLNSLKPDQPAPWKPEGDLAARADTHDSARQTVWI